MRNYLFFRPAVIILSALLIVLSGCASTAPSRFYVLNSLPSVETQVAADDQDVTIGIGPIQLPQYLDCPQIVTRIGPNELQLAEFDLWAEPLKDNVSRVLVANLSLLLGTESIAVFPWSNSMSILPRTIWSQIAAKRMSQTVMAV